MALGNIISFESDNIRCINIYGVLIDYYFSLISGLDMLKSNLSLLIWFYHVYQKKIHLPSI
jgi:hypothetical protein